MNVGRRLALVVMVSAAGAVSGWGQAPVARAELVVSRSQQIIVRGVVPERRVIVVDGQERIMEITSNTPNDVTPEVALLTFTGPRVPLTDAVRRQYEAVMRQVGGDKAVTIAPVPTPVADLFPDFVGTATPAEYEVTPGRSGSDPAVVPYRVMVR
jgi:hypothetical protein